MTFKNHGRQYDLVVFGATGYTGRLTAEYVTTHLPTDLKWAVAGRTESKLQGVVDECERLNPDRARPHIEIANLDDEELRSLAKKTFILITTVGPYSLYGEHALKACAETGTHYLDVTGETVWVNHMIKKYEGAAKSSGAILIPQIGVESAPADLITWAAAQHIRQKLGAPTKNVTVTININARPSGGTLATVLTMFEQWSVKEIREAFKPYAASPVPHEAPARPRKPITQMLFGGYSIPNLGLGTTSVAEETDASQVERTWGLLSTIPSRKDEFYGPKFVWQEYWKVRNWLEAFTIHWTLLFGGLLALLPPFRALARQFIYQPGEGPDRDSADKESVEYKALATPDTDKANEQQVCCQARYAGGMYSMTANFLGAAALTLLEDDVGLDGGILTPACLGQGFIDRADRGGFKMDLKVIQT